VYAVAAATHPGGSGREEVRTGGAAAEAGGCSALTHPIGVAVLGVAGMCAASLLDVVPAAAMTAPGVLAAAIAVAVTGHAAGVIGGAASGAAAGLAIGMGRRQSQERVRQEAELTLARQRSELEHDRAEVLAERNRIAREVHDVLAHTLSALSVQMEAIRALIDDGVAAADVRDAVGRSRRLVGEGLEETRRAVRVLRDEPVDAAEQIARLSTDSNAVFQLDGQPRPLPPAAGLALVRVAQEALTNSRKHAAGETVSLALSFAERSVELTIDNDASGPSALADSGSGYGLQGMRERIELVGGSLIAGPTDDGWRVRAVVPA
jgi:signal transduction histidine kinase